MIVKYIGGCYKKYRKFYNVGGSGPMGCGIFFFFISRLTPCLIVLADLCLIFWIFLSGSGAEVKRGIRNDWVGGVEISAIITGSAGVGRTARFVGITAHTALKALLTPKGAL